MHTVTARSGEQEHRVYWNPGKSGNLLTSNHSTVVRNQCGVLDFDYKAGHLLAPCLRRLVLHVFTTELATTTGATSGITERVGRDTADRESLLILQFAGLLVAAWDCPVARVPQTHALWFP